MKSRLDRRANAYKSVSDASTRRAQRQQASASVRKERRHAHRAKRRNLADLDSEDQTSQALMANMATIMEGFRSPASPEAHLKCAHELRMLLSIEQEPPVDVIVASGIVRDLIACLGKFDQPLLQFEVTWAITNIVSDRPEHTQVVVEDGGIQALVEVLAKSLDDGVREQAVWALGNIAGDGAGLRDMVIAAGLLPPLFRQFSEATPITMLRNATWALSNCCRGNPSLPNVFVEQMVPWLGRLVNYDDVEVITDALWGLAYLSDRQFSDLIVKSGACRKVVHLLMNHSLSVKTPAVRLIGNILAGPEIHTQIILNLGVLPCLLSLITHYSRDNISKEACWAIANIAAGSMDQIDRVIAANIIPPLLCCMSKGSFDVKQEAAFAISNICTGGTPKNVRFLVSQGCVNPLCDLLDSISSTTVLVALESLEHILLVGEMEQGGNVFAGYIEIAGGKSKIENLVHSSSDEAVNQLALSIVERFYETNGGQMVTEVMPTAVAVPGFSFNF